MLEHFKYLGNNINRLEFHSWRNYERIEVRQCLVSFGAESFAFQLAIQRNYKIYRIV